MPTLAWETVTGWKTVGDRFSRQLWRLESDVLCAQARRRTGLEYFGEPAIDPTLTVLLNSLENEADLHLLGRFFIRAHLLDLLTTRLQLVNLWSEYAAAIAASRMQRPIFITGMPRSGSTFLHELLAEDPANRAPRVWEVMFPVPFESQLPSNVDRRVRKTEFCLRCFRCLAPGADSVYPMRAWTPHECVAIHSYTLLSDEFVSTCHVPSYEAFLLNADLTPLYTWQKRFLQYLQLGCPEQRWVLKSPSHVYGLDKLLAVFPDALVIRTHREAIDVIKSQIRLTQVLEGMFARPCGYESLARREVRTIAEISNQMIGFDDEHPLDSERFVDVTYRELVTNPLAIVRRIYDRLGARLMPAVATQMERLATNRSRYPRRKLSAAPTLDCGAELARFEAYCSRFGVPLQTTN
jgi:sulfotransferase family protein